MKAFSRSGLAVVLVAGSILPISLASAQEITERSIKLAFANVGGIGAWSRRQEICRDRG